MDAQTRKLAEAQRAYAKAGGERNAEARAALAVAMEAHATWARGVAVPACNTCNGSGRVLWTAREAAQGFGPLGGGSGTCPRCMGEGI